MGRPSKNNAEYFPHYTSMRNHRKVKALRNKFGSVIGYGFWVMMLEWLTEQDGIEWEYSELECEMFAAELGVSATEIRDMVDFCIRIELLFKTDSGFIYSESLNEYLKAVFEKRQRAREKSKTRKRREDGHFCDRNTDSNVVSVTEMPQSKVKESKEDKSKVNNKTVDEVLDESKVIKTEIEGKEDSLNPKEKKATQTGGAREIFEEARKQFPGTKRGEATEWQEFEKKWKKDPEFQDLPETIKEAVDAQIDHRKALEKAKARFIPSWPNFSTWINQRRWEEELPELPSTAISKVIPLNPKETNYNELAKEYGPVAQV